MIAILMALLSSATLLWPAEETSRATAFAQATRPPFKVDGTPGSIVLLDLTSGDVNGDGRPDLLLSYNERPRLTILLNTGGRFRSPGTRYEIGRHSWAVYAGDLNRDGKVDIAAASSDSVTLLLGNGRGRFDAAKGSPFPVGGGTWKLAVADVNNDGKQELAASSLDSKSVVLLLGR